MSFLEKLFQKFENKLNEIGKGIEAGEFAVSEEDRKTLLNLKQAVYNAKASLKENLEDEVKSKEPTPKFQVEILSEHFEYFKDTFNELFKSYEENGPLYVPSYFNKIAEDKDVFDIINTYGDGIKNLAKPETEVKSINTVLDNPTWIKGMFNEYKKADENRKPATEHWNINEHSLKENFDKYLDDMVKVHNNFYLHIQEITGDNSKPYGTLKNKIGFITDFLDDLCLDGAKININFIATKINDVQKLLNPRNVTLVSNETLVCKNFFENTEKEIDETVLGGDLESKKGKVRPLSLEIAKNIEDEIHKLRLKSYNSGVDSNTLERMDNISKIITFPSYLRSNMTRNLSTSKKKDPSKDKKNELYGLFTKIDLINNKYKDFLNNGDSAKAPTMDDYDLLFDYMADYVIRGSQYSDKKGSENPNIGFVRIAAKMLSDIFPGRYTDRLNQLEVNYQDKINSEFKAKFKAMCTCSMEDGPNGTGIMEASWNSIDTLFRSGRLPIEDYEKAYFIRVARDFGFRNREMSLMKEGIHKVILHEKSEDYGILGIRNNNSDGKTMRPLADRIKEVNKKYLLCKALSFEYDSAVSFGESNGTLKDELLHPYNHKVSPAFSFDPLDDSKINTLEEYYSEFLNNSKINSLINLDVDAMERLINNGDDRLKKELYGEKGNVVATIDQDVLDALIVVDKDNSKEYTDISAALNKLATISHNFGGTLEADYYELFKACRTYLHTHDSAPMTERGQVRFDMTAKLMASIGIDMMEKIPAMRDGIIKEFELEMMRSRSFRENVISNAQNILGSEDSALRHNIARNIIKKGDSIGKVLDKNTSKGMITGKCETSEDIERVRTKYSKMAETKKKGFVDNEGKVLGKKELLFIKKAYESIYESYLSELREEPEFKRDFYEPIIEEFEYWKEDFDKAFEKAQKSSKPINIETFYNDRLRELWENLDNVIDRTDKNYNSFNKTYFEDLNNKFNGEPKAKDTIEGFERSVEGFKLTNAPIPGIEKIKDYDPRNITLNNLDEARKANSNTYRHINGSNDDPAKDAIFGYNIATEYVRSKAIELIDNDNVTASDVYDIFSSINSLLRADTVNGGKIRWEGVTAGKIDGISSIAIPVDLYRLMDTIAKNINTIKETVDPLVQKSQAIELASFTYQMTVSEHIFADGNGRSCRMLSDAILQTFGLPPHTPHTALLNTGATIGNTFDYKKGSEAFLRGVELSDEIFAIKNGKNGEALTNSVKSMLDNEHISKSILDDMDANQGLSFLIQVRENKKVLGDALNDLNKNAETSKEYATLKNVATNVIKTIKEEGFTSEKAMRAYDTLSDAINNYKTYAKGVKGDRSLVELNLNSIEEMKEAINSMSNLLEMVNEPVYDRIREEIARVTENITKTPVTVENKEELFAIYSLTQYASTFMKDGSGNMSPEMCRDLLKLNPEIVSNIMKDEDFKKALANFEKKNPSIEKITKKNFEEVANSFVAYKRREKTNLKSATSLEEQSKSLLKPAFLKTEEDLKEPVINNEEPKIENNEPIKEEPELNESIIDSRNIIDTSVKHDDVIDTNVKIEEPIKEEPQIIVEEEVARERVLYSVNDIMGMDINELSEVLNRANGDKELEFPTSNPLNGFSIDNEYVVGKTAEEIGEYFNANRMNLSDKQKQYLIGRAAGDLFFRKQRELLENREVTIPTLEEDGNIVRIPSIHLDSKQSTNNGCYSCSASLLLQSRGLNLTQWQVRAYREEFAGFDQARMLYDEIGNAYVLQGIATTCLPNVVAHEKNFTNLSNHNQYASNELRNQAKEEFKRIVTSAIVDHKSPVSLLRGGHYVTVVGIDVETGMLEVKNSMHIGLNPNDNEHISIEEVFNYNNISLTWLSDIDPQNPEKSIENHDEIEYIDGKYYTNQGDSIPYFGLDEINHGKEGINFRMEGITEGDSRITESIMLPVSPVFNINVPENVRRGNIVKKTADDPKKQELLNNLNNLTNALFPNDAKLAGTVRSVNDNYVDLRADEIHMVNAPGKNVAKDLIKACYYNYVKENLDVMTPYQVSHALDQKVVNNMVERFEKSDTIAQIISLNGTGSSISIDKVYKKFSDEMYIRSHSLRWEEFKDDRLTTLYNEMCERVNNGNPDRYDEASILHLNNYMRTKRNIDLEIPDIIRNREEEIIEEEPIIENENVIHEDVIDTSVKNENVIQDDVIDTSVKNEEVVVDNNPKVDEELQAGEEIKNPWNKDLGRVINLKFDKPIVEQPKPKERPIKEVVNFTTTLYYAMASKRISLDGTSNLNSILCYKEGAKDGKTILKDDISWYNSLTSFKQGEISSDYQYIKGLYEEAKAGHLVFVKPGDTISNAKKITVGDDGSVVITNEKSPLVNSDSRLNDTKYAAENLKDSKTLNLEDLRNKAAIYETLSVPLVGEAYKKGISSEDFVKQIMTTRVSMDLDLKARYKEYYNEGDYDNKISITNVPTKEQKARKELSEAAFKNYYLSCFNANNIRVALRDMMEQGEITEKEMTEVDHDRDFLDLLFEAGDSPEVINRNKERARKYLGKGLDPKDPEFIDKKLQAQAEVLNERMGTLVQFDYSNFYSMKDKDFVKNYPEYHKAGKVLSIFKKEYLENAKLNPYLDTDLGSRILKQEEEYGGDYFYNAGRIRTIANPAYEKVDPVQFIDMGPKDLDSFESFCYEAGDINIKRYLSDIQAMNSSKNARVSERLSRMMNTDGSGRIMAEEPLYYDEKGKRISNSREYFSYAKTGKAIYVARLNEPDSLIAFKYDYKTDAFSLVPENKYVHANIISEMKASVIAISEEKNRAKIEAEKRDAELRKAEERRNYYKDKSEEYDKTLNSSGILRASLTQAIKEMHRKGLSVEQYADDYANMIYKGTPKMSYDEFCEKLGIPENERLSKEEMNHRKALSAAAAKYIFNYENNRILGNNFEAKTDNMGFNFRVFSTVMFDNGIENLEKNKAKTNILMNGTNDEKKKLIEDRLTELMERSDKFLNKTFTDEELLDHMEEIMQVSVAAGMEMDGFNSGINDLEKKQGIVIDRKLLEKMASYREKIYQYNNYYIQKIDYMASEYYQYGGLDQFAKSENIESFMKDKKDYELARTATAVSAYSTAGIMTIAERLKESLEVDGKKIENFYDLEGKAIGTESFDLGTKYYGGGNIIVCYEGDPKPQILSLEGMNTFSPKGVSKGEPETSIGKLINSKRFDDRVNAINRKGYSNARKAFEESILNDQYKLALCMDETGNAHPENSAFVRDIADSLIAKLSIKRMLDQPGAPESLQETLLTKDSINRLKEDISNSGLGIEVIKALPHNMDSVLVLSSDKINKIITEKNSENLEKIKNNPPKKEEATNEFQEMVHEFKAEPEVTNKEVVIDTDPIETFLKEKIAIAVGSEVDENHLEEALGYFVTYGDDHNRNRIFVNDGKNSCMDQIKAAIKNGEKVFITIPDRKYHTLDTNEIVIRDGAPKLEIPKLEHDAMTVSIKGICKAINEVGEINNASMEFKRFKAMLNELAENGIPKDANEYYNSLNDLAEKAFNFGVRSVDTNMSKEEETLVTSASQFIEIYRAVCMHEKPSNDNMNVSMIASKFIRFKLSLDIKNGTPEVKDKALSIMGSYDKYAGRVAGMLNSKQFKDMLKDMSSKDIEKMARKKPEDIVKIMTKQKQKVEDNPNLNLF